MLKIDLTDKVALVLGGSRGIGAGIVETLCAAGGRVVFTYMDDQKHRTTLDELLARIRGSGGEATAIEADACDAGQTQRVVQEVVESRGRLDHLVCVVGQTLKRRPEEITDESWRRYIDINLSSAFYAVRAVLPHMERAGYGRIIFIGSSAVYDGGGGAIDYPAAKAGLVGMTAYLTRTYARKGILTNVIHPCVIDTDLLRERYGDRRSREKLIEEIPVGRLGSPADIAGLVAFLLSPLGDFICGQAILVDGGRTMF
jgi:NAD(P)-dependent dehydrogenase (short-subunit alcohol dehydrogenase family)